MQKMCMMKMGGKKHEKKMDKKDHKKTADEMKH
jgi:hypothetical protein